MNESEPIHEKYFVFTERDGFIEAVYWCETLKEAKKEARTRKKKYPSEANHVYIGERLT
jgi:hypothetical protein